MLKEIIICVTIVFSIFTVDKITQDYTEEKSSLIQKNLSSLRKSLLEEEQKDIIDSKLKKVEEDWEDAYKKLAYFIEHDELEKVETDITTLKSYIEMDDIVMAVSMIDESSFIIEHIKDKNDFSLKNVF